MRAGGDPPALAVSFCFHVQVVNTRVYAERINDKGVINRALLPELFQSRQQSGRINGTFAALFHSFIKVYHVVHGVTSDPSR